MRLAVILAVLMLSACATTGKGQIVTGNPVMAPGGYYALCASKDRGAECPR